MPPRADEAQASDPGGAPRAEPEAGSVIRAPAGPPLEEPPPSAAPAAMPALACPPPGTTALPPLAAEPAEPTLPRGDLARTPVPRLLAALHARRDTGALTLVRGVVRKLFLLERGLPALALSSLPAESFGARCVREGIVTAEALARIERGAAGRGPTPALLVEAGLLDEPRRAEMERGQLLDAIWSTFAWRDGTYRMVEGPLPEHRGVALGMDGRELVLEGMRRTGRASELRLELPGSAAVKHFADDEGGLPPLRPGEADLLAMADGTKTIDDLVALSTLPERDALAFLVGCWHLGLIREVPRALASTRRTGFL